MKARIHFLLIKNTLYKEYRNKTGNENEDENKYKECKIESKNKMKIEN